MKTAGAWISLCLIVLAGLAMILENDQPIVICDDKSPLVCVEEEVETTRGALTWQDWLRMPHETTYLEHKVAQHGKDVAVLVYQSAWEPMTQLFWLRLDL